MKTELFVTKIIVVTSYSHWMEHLTLEWNSGQWIIHQNAAFHEILPYYYTIAPCNMRVAFTTDQKGTLRFVGRQLWMWESGWKSRKNFGKEGSEGIGFLNGFTQWQDWAKTTYFLSWPLDFLRLLQVRAHELNQNFLISTEMTIWSIGCSTMRIQHLCGKTFFHP